MNGVDDLLSASLGAQTDALEVLFEHSSDCVKLIGLDGGLVRMNRSGLRAMEIDRPKDIVGAEWAGIWPEAHRAEVRGAVRKAVGGEVARFQGYCPTSEGKPKWWEVTVSPIRDSAGAVVALLSISRDVTDHAALRQALMTIGEGAVITGWSPEAQTMFGRSAEEVVGGPLHIIVPERLRENARTWIERFFAGGNREELGRALPGFALRRNGEEFPIECVFSTLPGSDGPVLLASIQAAISGKDRADLFETAFQSAPIGKALVSLDGRFLKLNAAFCKIVGYSEAALLATDFQAITHKADLDADLSFIAQLLAGEIPRYQMEKRYIRADGSEAWVELSVSLVRFPDGRPKFFIAQVQDQSARREAEERYRLLADNISDVVALNDEEGVCLYASPSIERVLGYSPDELIGQTPFAFLSEEAQARYRGHHAQLFDFPPGQTAIYQIPVRCKDGREIWAEAACRKVKDEAGRLLSVSVVRDITERMETERRYRLLADTTADVLVLANLDGQVTFVTGACERILGWSAEEVVTGPNRKTRVHPDDLARTRDLLARIRAGEKGMHVQEGGHE